MRCLLFVCLFSLSVCVLPGAAFTQATPAKFYMEREVDGQVDTTVIHRDKYLGMPTSQQLQMAKATFGPAPGNAPTLRAGMASTWCGTESSTNNTANAVSTEPQIKIVYAYPADRANRFATYRNVIQSQTKAASDVVFNASGSSKTLRYDMGTSCGADYLDITVVQLPRTFLQYTHSGNNERFARVDADIRKALGKPAQATNYLIYADHLAVLDSPLWSWAEGQLLPDDSHVNNRNELGGNMAALWGRGGADFFGGVAAYYPTTTLLHEITHTLGAIQETAPHSTGAGHCFDEWDHLCYSDGGPKDAIKTLCAGTITNEQYDCGKDDYFNAAPAAGSYLSTHWNLYDSPFMCPAAQCSSSGASDPEPQARLGVRGLAPYATKAPLVFDARASTGTGLRYAWDFDGNGTTDSTAPVVIRAYSQARIYQVKLTVTTALGKKSEMIKNIKVVGISPLKGSLTAQRASVKTMLAKGLRSIVASSGKGKMVMWLTLPPAIAKKYKISTSSPLEAAVISKKTVQYSRPSAKPSVFNFSRSIKGKLKGAKRLTFKVEARLVDRTGKARRVTKTVSSK